MHMLERARESGTRLVMGRVVDVRVEAGRVSGVTVDTGDEERELGTSCFVNAAGPYLGPISQLLGVEVPVFNEGHVKVAFRDTRDVVPVQAPLMIWCDPVSLPWSDTDHELLAGNDETAYLLEPFAGGVHARPEGHQGGHSVLILWTYESETVVPEFPLRWDPNLPDIALRGLSVMLPGLAPYLEVMPKTVVDGGYYTKTRENRPLGWTHAGCRQLSGGRVLGLWSDGGLRGGRPARGARLPALSYRVTRARLPSNDTAIRNIASCSTAGPRPRGSYKFHGSPGHYELQYQRFTLPQGNSMKYYDNVLELIGNTPLVKLNRMVDDSMATVLVKMEQLNPGGSVKDRMALNMVRRAEEGGFDQIWLHPG